MDRPIRVTFLGAGSSFTPRLVNDLVAIAGSKGGTFALVDIDADRLATMRGVAEKMIRHRGDEQWSVEVSTDRRTVLRETDYLVNCIEVSGVECIRLDNDIPARYGIDQCIGDTVGPGGLFKGLRTIPLWLEILRDAEELCPDALVLNYTNPMGMMCVAARRTSRMRVVGLCHSVQQTSDLLAQRAEVPYEEMEWECAGINHLAWFTRLHHQGTDLYPRLIEKARRDLEGNPVDPEDDADLVRKDIMVHFGAFVTESSGHLSEYLPYYRKRKDLLQRYCRPEYDGQSSFYADEWPGWRAAADRERQEMVDGKRPLSWPRSWEYASWIIEAIEKNVPYTIHGNVPNSPGQGPPLIENLSPEGCVEVRCLVDGAGVHPVRYGMLPEWMAGPCDWNMRMINAAATAAIERSKEGAFRALLLDPLTSAVCSPAEIRSMTLEMFEAEKEFLGDYR
jgi:alpha-galactosidase